MTDYAACNMAFRRQKSALTRAINKGNPDLVIATVHKHKQEWEEAPFNGMWPDDWARWDRAHGDAVWALRLRVDL